MLISHLNSFIGGIAFLLFLVRYKRHSFSENILLVFTGLTFISSSLWLYSNYYNHNINQILDFFGIFIENFLLLTAVLYIYSLGKKTHKSEQILFYIGLTILTFLLHYIHFKISSKDSFIFYPSNKNVASNILFQILIDCILFLIFLYLFYTKKSKEDSELFDGNFRKYILIAFSFYFIQDIFILIFFIIAVYGIVLPEVLINVTLLLNTITTSFLVLAAIYTNWLKEYNTLRSSKNNNIENNININTSHSLSIEDLKALKKVDWTEIYHNFKTSHNELLNTIENNDKLSPTEKLYFFLDYFNFSNKELSEILFVSIRTVETNFYRMRRKLKE